MTEPTLVPDIPNLRCRECGLYLYPERQSQSPWGKVRLHHPYKTDYELDLDIELYFCPNNAKVWELTWPDGIVEQVAP